MHRRSPLSLACLLVFSSVILGLPGAGLALDAGDLPNAIENAKTPADHEAIAAYYDAEAKAAHAMIARHSAMAAAYKKTPMRPAGKGVALSVYRTMPSHCDNLVGDYKSAANEYEAMAAAHRKLASESQ